MSYKRITERDEFGNADIFGVDSELLYNELSFTEANALTKAFNYLAEIEDKIENGTLIDLPCKYGDTVWFVYEMENDEMFLDEGVIQSFSIDSCGLWFYVIYKSGLTYWHKEEDLGEKWFLTKAEAEKRLKEQQNER